MLRAAPLCLLLLALLALPSRPALASTGCAALGGVRPSPSAAPSTRTSAATSPPPCAAAGRILLVINRRGVVGRRDACSTTITRCSGYDRDEYPPFVARGRLSGYVRYVPSSENRSHGATMGNELRGFCDGTRFRYVFR